MHQKLQPIQRVALILAFFEIIGELQSLGGSINARLENSSTSTHLSGVINQRFWHLKGTYQDLQKFQANLRKKWIFEFSSR